MPQDLNFSFGPDSNPARSSIANDTRIVNGFIEKLDQGKGGAQYGIYSDFGSTQFSDLDQSSIRGHFQVGSSFYVVAGERLYKVTSGGAKTQIGIVAGQRQIRFDINRNATAPQVAIVADTTVYELQADVLQTFQDPDLPAGVVDVAFLDTYFAFLLQTGVWYYSDQNATSVDALSFFEVEARADKGIGVIAFEERFWFFGEETIETWTATGNADAPFQRDNVIERGCLSKYTILPYDNSLTFVDDLGRVIKLQGLVPAVISNPAVERDISRARATQTIDQIEALTYAIAGHQFYQISGTDWTWVHDAATQTWHQKKSYGSSRSVQRTYVRAFDKDLFGSNTDGVLFQMTDTDYDENGQPIVVELRSPNLGPFPGRVTWFEVTIDAEMGVGNNVPTDTTNYDPQVMFDWSDDGGATFSNARFQSLGKEGVRNTVLKFTALGMSGKQGRMFRLRTSAAVRKATFQANARFEVLSG